jgi:hypothetical protein
MQKIGRLAKLLYSLLSHHNILPGYLFRSEVWPQLCVIRRAIVWSAIDASILHEELRKTRPLSFVRWGAPDAFSTMLPGNWKASRGRQDVLPAQREHLCISSSSAYALHWLQPDPNDWCGSRSPSNREAIF